MRINEDFWDDKEAQDVANTKKSRVDDIVLPEDEDIEPDELAEMYRYCYELQFNIIQIGEYKNYNQYIENVAKIVKIVKKFLDTTNIFYNHSYIILCANMPSQCNSSIDINGYRIYYNDSGSRYHHGLKFNLDNLFVVFYTNNMITNVSRFNRFINFLFKYIAGKDDWYGCTLFNVINNERHKDKDFLYMLASRSFKLNTFENSTSENMKYYIENYAEVLNVCGKPGIVSEWLKSNEQDVADVIVSDEKKTGKLVEIPNCEYVPFEFNEIMLTHAGTSRDAIDLKYDWLNNKLTRVYLLECLEFSESDVNDLFDKTVKQISETSAEYKLKSFKEYNENVEYYLCFYDTIVFKDYEFSFYLKYIDITTDYKVDPVAIKLLLNAGYDFDSASNREICGKWTNPQNREAVRKLLKA